MKPNEIANLARLIDHAVLHPTTGRAELEAAISLAREHQIAALCVKPCDVRAAAEGLAGSTVAVCAVTAFPHGNAATRIKVAETSAALEDGATEIDTVVNNGLVQDGNWDAFLGEIQALVEVTHSRNALLKVIFETDYLNLGQIAKMTDLCCQAGADFVKTSTGFGYVKQANGDFNYEGATVAVVKCMLETAAGRCGVKASAGIRSLDDLLRFRDLGCTRIGVGSTAKILAEARARAEGSPSSAGPSAEGY
ncbi:MAG: deoxyribose-phosphate aldolase [Opitutales bacterium]|nr:deoxyribose-phosphate aldolase [Opitutales bacterium]